ncbi:MAG: phosphatase PAP2 family protein [Candidatus Firestonebacteria bacterium]
MIILFVLFFNNGYCEEYNFFTNVGNHLGEEVLSPFNVKLEDFLIIAPVSIITYSILKNDTYFRDKFNSSKNSTLDFISFIDILGDGMFDLAICGVVDVIGGKKERLVTRQVVESIVETGIIVNGIKCFLGRVRPSSNNDPLNFIGPSLTNDSFPSGHTAVAWVVAEVVGNAYNCYYITYPLATLVGLARVYKDAHWFSDVFVGAVIGILIGKVHKIDYSKEDIGLIFKYENEKLLYEINCRF